MFGKSYWGVHKYKDEPSQIYRHDHRKIRHQDFSEVTSTLGEKGLLPFAKRFNDAFQFIREIPFGLLVSQTESLKAGIFHEVWDGVLWKGLPKRERAYRAAQIALGILYEGYYANVQKKLDHNTLLSYNALFKSLEPSKTRREYLYKKYPSYKNWTLVYSIKEILDEPLEVIESRLEILKPTVRKEIFDPSERFKEEINRIDSKWKGLENELEDIRVTSIPHATMKSIESFITQEVIKQPSSKAIEMLYSFFRQHPNLSTSIDFLERMFSLLEEYSAILFTNEGRNIAWSASLLTLTKVRAENSIEEIDKSLSNIRKYIRGKKPIELV